MRVKRGTKCRKRHKKTLNRAEGFVGRSGNTWRAAVQRTEKAMTYEFRDRKVKKREFRALWVTRINAAARLNGLSYSRLIAGLKAAKVEIDRKVLADLGASFPSAFAAVAETAKKALASAA